MAKRFGRNQRRKMQQQVARLEHDLHVTGTQYHKVCDEQRDLRRSVENLLAELPEGSPLKAELDELAVHDYMRGMRYSPTTPPHLRMVRHGSYDQVVALVDLMAYRITADPDLLEGRLRFRVDTTDETAAYMVDRRFFEAHGFSPRMVQEIAERIAYDLAKYFSPARSKRRG